MIQGAELACSMGNAAATFAVASPHGTDAVNAAAGTIDDFAPNTNIATFGMCQSLANPEVASATAAAQGTLTPQPCNPVVTAPWSPGATVTTLRQRPALTDACSCACQWGGSITVTNAGQQDVDVE